MCLGVDEAYAKILVRWVVGQEAHVGWLHVWLVAADIADGWKVGTRSTEI